VAVVALYGVRFALADDQPATGLLAAWPVLVLGLVLVPRARLAERPIALVAAVAALFAAAVLATQYAEGGGLEWGGRFFSPALAPLAVLAAVGLRGAGPLVRPAAIGIGVAPALLGLAVVASARSSAEPFFDEVAEAAGTAPLAVTTIEHLPRALWEHDDEIAWMMAPEADLAGLLDDLVAGGVDDVVLVTSASVDRAVVEDRFAVAADLSGPTVRERGRLVLRLVPRPADR
jgi:hypothetical protein